MKLTKKFGTEDAKVYTDFKELLRDESIEVVHVCTPNRSHSFITVDALEAGKHVMCEKPMAKTAADTVVQVATNDLIILIAFTPIVAFLLGVSGVAVPWDTLIILKRTMKMNIRMT